MGKLALTPELLFMYLFVPLGALAVLLALLRASRDPTPIKPWLVLMLGGLMLGGTGGFGPSFLTTYGGFLEKVARIDPASEEGTEDYRKLANDLGAGRVEPKYQQMAQVLLKEKAGRDAQSVLDESIKNATVGRPLLEDVKHDLDRRSHAAAVEATGAGAVPVRVPASVDFAKLPAETLRDLNTQSDAKLNELAIDPKKLRAAARSKVIAVPATGTR